MSHRATGLALASALSLLSLSVTAAVALPGCADLAAILVADPQILSATATITPAAGGTPAYCQVNLTQFHAINIRVGLPLSAANGGTGGVQGAWNGKVQNLGGGGYAGSVGAVTSAVATGYVGSSTDTGHSAAWCNAIDPATGQPNSQPNCGLFGGGFVLDPQNHLIAYQVTDFIRDSLHAQTTRALSLAKAYYGMDAIRNYWNGCSTGGRQGFEMAQEFGDLFDGLLVGAPAMNWNRFIISNNWPPVVAHDLLGASGLSPAKSNAANAAAIAACDAADGVTDGLINEPRRCSFDATSLICTGSPGDPPTCLTATEAQAVNQIWDGPRDASGQRLWGGLNKGTSFGTLLPGGNVPNDINRTYVLNWMHQDPAFDWREISEASFPSEYYLSEWKFRSTAATDNSNLDKVRNRGGKIIHYHGISDPLIPPFGSYNYAHRVFSRYGVAGTQTFMRSFFYPGNGHCGGGSAPLINGPDLFNALVNWVENGVAPDYIVARQNLGGGVTRTRKICKYPDESVFDHTGSSDDQASFHCEVHAVEPADLAAASETATQELNPDTAQVTVWVGLKNSDDVGARFDLRAELYSGDALVGAGETHCVTGASRSAHAAKAVTVALSPRGDIAAQDPLSLKLSARVGTGESGGLCGGHSKAAGVRLYYDGTAQPAGFKSGLAPGSVADFFLHSSGGVDFPDTSAPTSTTAKFKDSAAVNFANGNVWRPIGTWSE